GLMGDDRKRLVSGGLVLERRGGGPLPVEPPPPGWAAGVTPLTSHAPGKGGAAPTNRPVVDGPHPAPAARGGERKELFFGADCETAVPDVDPVEERIRAAYRNLATEPAGWVSLADLRELLADIPRQELDTALKWMAVQPGVRLIPVANQKSLSTREHDAALRF